MKKAGLRLTVYQMILCASFAALIAAGAFIKIPLYPVPVTLQVQFVLLAGLLLGSRKGAVSVGIYILIGLLGLPVFARGGGPGYVLQPTFGYILGFALGAYAAGKYAEKKKQNTLKVNLTASLAGLSIVYAAGILYVWLISRFYLNKETGVWYLLLNCILLPLPGDIGLCAVGSLLATRLKPLMAVRG